MRSKLEIEKKLEFWRTAFQQTQEPESSMRCYVAYRSLYWVLHPELDDWFVLVEQVNISLGLKKDAING